MSFQIKRSIPVHYKDGATLRADLNELEYFKGSIYANIHDLNLIFVLKPASGEITDEIDFTGLLEPNWVLCELNGIAYDKDSDHLFVTGKNWSKIFEIRLI